MKSPRRNIWSYPVLRLVAYDRCRVAAPWFAWRYARTNAAYLRRLACLIEQNHFVNVRSWERWVAALLYFPLSLVHIVKAMRLHGPRLRFAYSIPLRRQFFQLVHLAWRHALRPQVYYYLRLQSQPGRRLAQYLDPAELHHLQRTITTNSTERIEDKLAFHLAASPAGLPLVPLLAIFDHGRQETPPASSLFVDWEQDLIVKPTSGYSSSGLRGFRYDQNRYTCVESGNVYTREELAGELSATSAGQTLIVQPWLRNHESLARFSTGALCNFRVVTARNAIGGFEVIMAALRFPIRSELTCAEQNVTLCTAVDLVSGKLAAAEAKDPGVGRLDLHPMTGQPIEGFIVDAWPEIRALALRAHEEFAEFPFIGWDIAHSNLGLVLLEGSTLWGGYLAQMSGSAPLGASRFASLYLENLHALNSGQRLAEPAEVGL